jgi:ribosome-binding factor A
MGRIEKVNQMVKREISNMLQQDIKDPRLVFVSITDVEVSKDLRHARVSFSVLGGDDKVRDAKDALDHAKGYIRKLVGDRVRLRYTPQFEFFYDQSIAYGARIEQAFEEIKHAQEGDRTEQKERGK